MWGWDDRAGSFGNCRLSQHDEATASTAKIIPLRPWFDPPSSGAENPHVKVANETDRLTEARSAEAPSVEPFRPQKPKVEGKAEARTEAKPEARA